MEQKKIGELPEGWSSKHLKDVARIFAGSAAPQDSKYYENWTVPFVRTSDLWIHWKTTNLTTTRDKLNSDHLNSNLVKAKKWTVLFPKSGASILTNNRALLGMDAFIVSHLGAIYSDESVTNKYIYHFLSDYDLGLLCENEAYPSLKLGKVGEIEIPLPPLAEQERIVAKLDGIFEHIDASIKLLEQNIADADLMAESVLNENFNQKWLPNGWKIEKLRNNWEVIRWVSYKKEQLLPSPDGAVSLMRANNIGDRVNLTELQYIPFHVIKPQQLIKDWDSLVCMSSGSRNLVGKSVMLRGLEDFTFGAFCGVFRPSKERLLPGYVSCYLRSESVREKLASLWNGAWISNIKPSDIENLDIPLPPLVEQERIVAKLDAFFVEQKAMKAKYESRIAELKNLKSSILSSAFRGEI